MYGRGDQNEGYEMCPCIQWVGLEQEWCLEVEAINETL